jgi:tetratricopeptide (TPR) repeat protein
LTESERSLQQGAGLWLRGPPGGGRSHRMRAIASAWAGPVLWLRDGPELDTLGWLDALPRSVLLCLDDAPEDIARARFGDRPIVATGPRPGSGWEIEEIGALPDDDSVRLFLQHAPGAEPHKALRQLVRRLDGHPTAIIAAARRWPAARVETLLLDPSPAWPGLESAYGALSAAERDALALLCRLPGPTRLEGLRWCGQARGAAALVTAGWISVQAPGMVQLPLAVAQAIRPWQEGDVEPYFAWFLRETRPRAEVWDTSGGSREWFRAGLWPVLWARQDAETAAPWFFTAWSLSGEDGAELLSALAERPTLPPVLAARCAARAHQAAGERSRAVESLLAVGGSEDAPEQHALALMERGVAHHRLRQLDDAREAYAAALSRLEALSLRRGRMLCHANMAALAHDVGSRDAARTGYEQAIAEATALGELRLRGICSSNLGALLVELDELDAARAVLHLGARNLAEERDDRFSAIVQVNLAAVDLLEGHLDAADGHYREALRLLGETDPATIALCHARRGAVAALRSDLDASRSHHERAEATITILQDPITARLVSLWRVFLEWQAGDRASALGRRRDSRSGEPSLLATSDEARLVVRLLERLARQPGETVVIGPGGAWLRLPGAERVSVQKYAAVALILELLARTAEDAPGQAADADVLIAAGWPGEQIGYEAARNRLSVALARLRRLGMRELIQRTRDGWRLDPDWPVILLRAEEPSSL